MSVDFLSHESWSRRAAQHFPVDFDAYAVKGGGNSKVRITPSIARFRSLTVSGRNWLAMTSDRKCTLEAMVHDPVAYAAPGPKRSRHEGAAAWVNTKEIQFLAQPAVLVGGTHNYYHWLADYLPRLLLVRGQGLLEQRIVLLNSDMSDLQRQALDLMALPAPQRFPLADTASVYCDDILVPAMMTRAGVMHPCVAEMLRNAFPARTAIGPQRIYLDPTKGAGETLVNEPEVFRLLQDHGFERCDPGALDFQSQIDLFAGAQIVVGVHSDAMTNLIFAPLRTQVIEIHSPRRKSISMFMLSLALLHSHSFVRANEASGGWQVDMAQLSAALNDRLLDDKRRRKAP